MALWIESHQSIGRHPKLNKLRALSGWSKHEAIGVMHDLWHWVLTYAEDGDISRFTSSEIAIGIDIDPAKFDVQTFIDMLISAGFVRADLKMHDWLDYAGKYLTSKYRTNDPAKLSEIQKKYATKGSPSKVRLKSVQSPCKGRLPTVPNQQYLTVPTVPNQHNPTVPNEEGLVEQVVSYLNSVLETNYKPEGKKTNDLIKARQAQGFTLDDFKTVIGKKAAEWKNDPKMHIYLRPETLFGSKFESYLNQRAGPAPLPYSDTTAHNIEVMSRWLENSEGGGSGEQG